jgi:putative heme transporter
MNEQNQMMTSAAQNNPVIPRWRPSLRQVVQTVLGLGLAVALLGWGLPLFVGITWAEVFDVLGKIGGRTALELLGLMICGLWLYTFTLTGSLPGLSHPKALILNVCGSSVGNLLPGGGAAGLAATYGICRSWGFSRPDISISVVVSGVWNVLGRVALPVVGAAILLTDAAHLPKMVVRGGAIGAVAGLAVLALFIAVIVSERAATLIGRGLDKALRPLMRKSQASGATSIDDRVHDLRSRLKSVVRTGWRSMTFGVFGFLGVYYVLFWFCLEAVGVQMTFAHMFAAYAMGRILSTVGVTPGGLGITETGTVAVLIALGADPAAAMAGTVLFSIYIHLLEIPIGAIGWVVWGVSRKKSPQPDPALQASDDVPPVVASPTN